MTHRTVKIDRVVRENRLFHVATFFEAGVEKFVRTFTTPDNAYVARVRWINGRDV